MEFDHTSVLKTPFKILELSGFWQTDKKSYKVYGFITHLMLLELHIIYLLISVTTATNIRDFSDILTVVFILIGLSIISLFFMHDQEIIIDLVEEFRELLTLSKFLKGKPLSLVKPRVLKIQQIFYLLWYTNLLVTFLNFLALGFNNIVNTDAPESPRYKILTPHIFEDNVLWLISMGIFRTVGPLLLSGIVASLYMLPNFFLNAAAGLLDELSEALSEIGQEEKNEKKKQNEDDDDLKQLEKCIEHHLRIKAFIENTEKMFSSFIFVQGATNLLILGANTFNLSKVCFEFDNIKSCHCSGSKTGFNVGRFRCRQVRVYDIIFLFDSGGSSNSRSMLLRK